MRKRLLASVGIASLLVLGLPTSALAASETVVDTPAAPILVDGSTLTRPLEVTAAGLVEKVTIEVDFLTSNNVSCMPIPNENSYPNELGINLVSPGGTSVALVSNESPTTYGGFAFAERVQVAFADSAEVAVGSTNSGAPESGTFRPAQPLSAFDGEPAAGTWQLAFSDNNGDDAKCYFGASLTIDAGDPTTTTLTASSTWVAVGLPITLTAAVADEVQPNFAARSALPPTGTVTFMEGTTTLGSAALDGTGSATLPISFATSGEHLVTAIYSGDADHATSTSTEQLIEAYDRYASITTLAASQTSIMTGESSTFTATIDHEAIPEPALMAAANGPELTGTVQFLNGTTLLGEAPVVDGQATATFLFPTAGLQPVTAMYSGDVEYAGSASAVVEVTVAARAAPPVVPPTKAPAKPLANTGASAPATGAILWGLGLAAAGLLTAGGARRARRTQAS